MQLKPIHLFLIIIFILLISSIFGGVVEGFLDNTPTETILQNENESYVENSSMDNPKKSSSTVLYTQTNFNRNEASPPCPSCASSTTTRCPSCV